MVKPVCETESVGNFFSCVEATAVAHMKNQRNVTPPKQQNRVPLINPKEIES